MTHKITILRLLKTASPQANKLVLFACVLLLLKILVFNRYDALFFGAYELGIIFEAILASVIASYIFYIFVVHLKELSDRNAYKPYFKSHSLRIVRDCVMCLKEMSEKSGIELDFSTCTREQVEEALLKINPSADANLYLGNLNRKATIQEYFWYISLPSRTSCKCLLEKLNFMTVAETKMISDIEECSYFDTAKYILREQLKNTDCSFLSSSLSQYVNSCRLLSDYAKSISDS